MRKKVVCYLLCTLNISTLITATLMYAVTVFVTSGLTRGRKGFSVEKVLKILHFFHFYILVTGSRSCVIDLIPPHSVNLQPARQNRNLEGQDHEKTPMKSHLSLDANWRQLGLMSAPQHHQLALGGIKALNVKQGCGNPIARCPGHVAEGRQIVDGFSA